MINDTGPFGLGEIMIFISTGRFKPAQFQPLQSGMWFQSPSASGDACTMNDRHHPVKVRRVNSDLKMEEIQIFAVE